MSLSLDNLIYKQLVIRYRGVKLCKYRHMVLTTYEAKTLYAISMCSISQTYPIIEGKNDMSYNICYWTVHFSEITPYVSLLHMNCLTLPSM